MLEKNSLDGSTIWSLIDPNKPPSLTPSLSSLPKIASLNALVSVANPNADPRITLVAIPNGPVINPATAPTPILGKTFLTLSGNPGPNNPSSPNKALWILSLFLANPIEDPTIIPATGPPGTNGKIDVIAPTVAPLPISGKYFSILLLIFLLSTPPFLSPFSSISPNNHFLTASEFLISPIEAPAAAPSKGPPIIPVINDVPAPIIPPLIISGAYFLIFPITSVVILLKSSLILDFILLRSLPPRRYDTAPLIVSTPFRASSYILKIRDSSPSS